MSNYIPDWLDLRSPLFYDTEYSIRFEIGDPNIECFTDEYFTHALERALTLWLDLFGDNEVVKVIVDSYVPVISRDKYDLTEYTKIAEYFIDTFPLVYSMIIPNRYDEDDEDGVLFRQVYMGNIKDLDIYDLLLRKLRCDTSLQPKFEEDIFFVSKDNSIVYFLYDDRGLDVASHSIENLRLLYNSRNRWILNYDKELIDNKFGDVSSSSKIHVHEET